MSRNISNLESTLKTYTGPHWYKPMVQIDHRTRSRPVGIIKSPIWGHLDQMLNVVYQNSKKVEINSTVKSLPNVLGSVRTIQPSNNPFLVEATSSTQNVDFGLTSQIPNFQNLISSPKHIQSLWKSFSYPCHLHES